MNDGLMKFVIGAIVIVGLAVGGYHLNQYWGKFKDVNSDTTQPAAAPVISGDALPGMPANLEGTLNQAKLRGATGLHDFLQMYGNTISDPRRAWIELDYMVLLAQTSPGEARQEFAKIKSRITPSSPVYNRMKQLEKTYE